MKLMKVLLWIIGIGCLLAIPLIFFPWSLIQDIIIYCGGEATPFLHTTVYSFRLIFGVMGLIGVFFVLLALEPMENERMLVLGGVGLIVFGILALILGLIYTVANLIFIGDTVVGLIFGVAILALFVREKVK